MAQLIKKLAPAREIRSPDPKTSGDMIMRKMELRSGRRGTVVLMLFVFSLVLTAEAFGAGVSLSASPTSRTVFARKAATYTINIWRTDYTGKIAFRALDLPAGATATFSPDNTVGNSTTLTVQTLATTPAGSYTLLIKADAPNIFIQGINLQLQVNPMPTLSVSTTPTNQSIVAGQSTYSDISISRTNFTGTVTLTAENVLPGVTVQFSPASTSGNTSRMIISSTGLPFLSANYDMIVRGQSSSGVYNTAPFQLRVNPGITWADQFGTPNNQTANPDFATDVTYDAAGNAYVTGYTSTAGETDTWVAKYNSSGTRLWLRMITSLSRDLPTDVFVNAAGQVFVAGRTLVLNTANMEIFIAKFDSNGNPMGSVLTLGTTLEEGSGGIQFGVNATGNVTLTAPIRIIRSAIILDSAQNEVFSAEYDIARYVFDANFNQTNTTLVSRAIGNPKDIAVGSDDSLYVLSENRSQVSPVDGRVIVTSRVEKFRSPLNQNYQSAVIGPTVASPTLYFANRLKVDSSGNVFAIGNEFDRTARVTNQTIPENSWMIKLNGVGSRLWETKLLSYYASEITALDTDTNGDVYYAGNTWDSLRDANPNPGGPGEPTARTDAWFAKYSGATGTPIFLNQFNVNDKDGFNAIKVGAVNGISTPLYFAGYTVAFKNVNYGFEDGLFFRCSTLYCGYQP
jgi:hypothetical protein